VSRAEQDHLLPRSHLRRISTNIDKNSKLIQPRKLHGTQWEYFVRRRHLKGTMWDS
jgi:DNA-directed RNA polymerase beta subunit